MVISVAVGGPEAMLLEELAPVYAAAFAAPPWSEPDATDLLRRAPRHSQRSGFAVAVARDGQRVIGFAYGVTAHPRSGWIADLVDGPGVVFELVELAVLPEARGRGVGSALLDAMLEERPETQVALQTHVDAVAATRLYERAGFRRIGPTDVGVAMLKQVG